MTDRTFPTTGGWVVLRTPADWEDYRRDFAEAKAWRGTVDWGRGPQTYPALVATCATGFERVANAFVYPEDAAALLHFAGDPRFKVGDNAAAASSTVVNAVGPTQAETNRHVAAMLLTLVQTVGVDPGMFEQRLAANLAAVDAYQAEQRDNVLKVVDHAAAVLPRVLPQQQSPPATDSR